MGIGIISGPATMCSKGSTPGLQVCVKDHYGYVCSQGQRLLCAEMWSDLFWWSECIVILNPQQALINQNQILLVRKEEIYRIL